MAESFPFKFIFDAVDNTKSAMGGIKKNLGGLMAAAGTAATALAGAAATVGGFALKEAGDIEQLQVRFESLAGGADEAKQLIGDLSDFAAKTPFQLKDLGNASAQLMAFGTEVKDLPDELALLGDISAGVQKPLKELVEPFGRIKAANRVTLEELNKFEDRGVSVIKRIADQTNSSYADVKDTISKGGLDFENFRKALTGIRTDQFFNQMAKQSETFHGKNSTILDNLKLNLAELGTLLFEVFDVKGGQDLFIEFLGNTRDILKELNQEDNVKVFKDLMDAVIGLGGEILQLFHLDHVAEFLSQFDTSDFVSGVQSVTDAIRTLTEWLDKLDQYRDRFLKYFMSGVNPFTGKDEFEQKALLSQVQGTSVMSPSPGLKDINLSESSLVDSLSTQGQIITQGGIKGAFKNNVSSVMNNISANPELINTAQSVFSNDSQVVTPQVEAQKADLAITVDVVNNKAEVKAKEVKGFNLNRDNIKVGKAMRESI